MRAKYNSQSCSRHELQTSQAVHTSVESRLASKVTLVLVESIDGGMDDKNLWTLLCSSGDRADFEFVVDILAVLLCYE
jgi:hypothetical protein